MKQFKGFFIFLILVSILFTPYISLPVTANWYSYYVQSGYYGIWATIITPVSEPYMPSYDHQSHSVSTPGGGRWVQSGWIFYPDWYQPRQYMEFFNMGLRDLVELNDQPWGTGIKYEVSYDGSNGWNRWCVWVGGIKRGCWNDITPAPTQLIAQSETHFHTNSVFWTNFTLIRLQNTNGLWVYPTLQNNMQNDPPYSYSILTNESFRTWRHGIFMPLIVR